MTTTATPKRRNKKPKNAASKRQSTTKAGTTKAAQRGKVVYPELGVTLRNKDNPLSVEDAKQLLGWISETEATETTGKKVQYGKEYHLRDFAGNKVRLTNNLTNRPFRMGLARRYANELLRGKWRLNGETIVIDRYGMMQDGQHRLAGLILAEQLRQKEVAKWRAYGVKGVLTMDALIVTGIDPKPDTVDTINLGQKRSLGDVLFRNQQFGGEITENDQRRLANILSTATRLVWERVGGKITSDAPHFPHSEALAFVEKHPELIKAALFIYQEDGNDKRISSYVSLGYATGLMFLLAASSSDPDTYQESGAYNLELWDKAEEFWVVFGSGGKDLHALRTVLARMEAYGGAQGKAFITGTVVKGMNLWMDNKPVEAKTCKVKKKRQDDGKLIVAEYPRLGGMDTEVELVEPEPEPETETDTPAPKGKKAATKKAKRSKGGWQVGDLAWVNDEEGDHWFGTIKDIFVDESTKDKLAQLEDENSGGVFEVGLSSLSVKKPE